MSGKAKPVVLTKMCLRQRQARALPGDGIGAETSRVRTPHGELGDRPARQWRQQVWIQMRKSL